MIREYHGLNGHQFEQTPGDNGRLRSLLCYSPWTCKELNTTWGWNNSNIILLILSKKVPKLIWPIFFFFFLIPLTVVITSILLRTEISLVFRFNLQSCLCNSQTFLKAHNSEKQYLKLRDLFKYKITENFSKYA